MLHRTYGETKNCMGCRYWSEMLAQCSDGPVQAMCISGVGENKGKYLSAQNTCDSWESGHDGAIDEPGSDPLRYKQQEKE